MLIAELYVEGNLRLTSWYKVVIVLMHTQCFLEFSMQYTAPHFLYLPLQCSQLMF